jgi:hypothetical protein
MSKIKPVRDMSSVKIRLAIQASRRDARKD